MTVYVDEIQEYKTGLWCHMATDGDVEDLHKLARQIGLKRSWFQDHPLHPHYDLRPDKRALALLTGAVAVSNRELVVRCSAYFDGRRCSHCAGSGIENREGPDDIPYQVDCPLCNGTGILS